MFYDRKSKDKKMVLLREKSGCRLRDILVIGKTTAKMVSESSFINKETSTKACGVVIKDMDKVLIGEMKVEN